MRREVLPDAAALADHVAEALQTRLAALQADGGVPRLVLTGGGIANRIYERLWPEALDWDRVELYFGDERFVPADHEENNARQAREAFIDRVGATRVHPMPPHSCDYSMAEAAERYAAVLGDEAFDLVLLGIGPDGHVASLFPGHDSLQVDDRLVIAEFSSPKPPPQRLSLTFAALNAAEAVWFLASGAEKAQAVARAWSGDAVSRTPAAGVRGRAETAWFLDEAAAAELP